MEVKGCTLEINGVGYFPDAPTERGVKHIYELIDAVRQGYKAIIAFVIQMNGITTVLPNRETHPEFADAFEKAIAAGVKLLLLPCDVKKQSVKILPTSYSE